jgi:hypothetical protein
MRRLLWQLVFGAIVGLMSGSSVVASDDNWDSSFGVPGSADTVGGLLSIGSDVYATGAFTNIGGVHSSHIARFDGTNWSPLAEGINSPTDMTVPALASFRGSLYAAGVFQQAGTNSVNNIARWDGINWFPCATGVNGIVRTMTVAEDRLIVAGTFTVAGGVLVTNVAAWDGTNWASVGSGISGIAIDSLAAIGGTIYAGGRFRVGAGINATNIAHWNGTTWSGLGEGIRGSDQGTSGGHVRALVATPDGVFAAGSFRLAGKTPANNIARWDGTNWWPLGDGIELSGNVYAMALNGSAIYAAGRFSSAGGIAANDIAVWNGTQWSPLASGIGDVYFSATIFALAARGAELFAAGGSIISAGGKPSTNIALWHVPHTLSVSCAKDTVRLSWPATGTNFVLEAKEDVAGTDWSVVSTNPVIVDNQCRVTNQIDSPARFFRLRRK